MSSKTRKACVVVRIKDRTQILEKAGDDWMKAIGEKNSDAAFKIWVSLCETQSELDKLGSIPDKTPSMFLAIKQRRATIRRREESRAEMLA